MEQFIIHRHFRNIIKIHPSPPLEKSKEPEYLMLQAPDQQHMSRKHLHMKL